MNRCFQRQVRAFTLVELLVAIAVLSLLVLIIVQVVSLTGLAIDKNSKSLDAAGQARLVFDRIGSDLAARPGRSDLRMVLTKAAAGSDCLRFYSHVSGYSMAANVTARGITAIGYWVPSTSGDSQHPVYQLERGAVGTDWTTGPEFFPATLTEADVTAADNPLTAYDVLASGVFRLEFCYLETNGSLTIKNPNTDPTDLTGISAVVIALGVVDSKSLQLLSSPATQLLALSSALPKTTEGDDPLADWNNKINAGLTVAGIPKPVLQNLRVYERTFYVQ